MRGVNALWILPAFLFAGSGCDRDASDTTARPDVTDVATEPPEPAASPDRPRITATATSATGSFTARWSMPDPIPVGDPFSVDIELFADPACTVPLDEGNCRIDAAMPHHGHGMNVAPRMRRESPGRWKAAGMLLHMPGRWEVFVDLDRDGLLERAQSTVTLP